MIYAPIYDALPDAARTKVQARLAAVLTGKDTNPKYAHLTPSLRAAITEIVGETKPQVLW
jgi:hypothetical protein